LLCGGKNKGYFYTQSTDNGDNFLAPDRISPLGSHPQICSFTNGDLLVAWDESVQVNNEYFKRIVCKKERQNARMSCKPTLHPIP
jgi:hypothetical protein